MKIFPSLDVKTNQQNSDLPFYSNYLNNILELITYVDKVLEDPLRDTKEKRIRELNGLSSLILKTEQNITKLLKNNNELNFSQFNSVKWYLKGRRNLLEQQKYSL